MFDLLQLFLYVLITVLLTVGILVFFQLKGKDLTLVLPLTLATVHLLLVIRCAIAIWKDMKLGYGEALMGWIFFDIVDFPVSILLYLIEELLRKLEIGSFMVWNYWLPLFFFGIIGTIQYYLIGVIIGWIVQKVQE